LVGAAPLAATDCPGCRPTGLAPAVPGWSGSGDRERRVIWRTCFLSSHLDPRLDRRPACHRSARALGSASPDWSGWLNDSTEHSRAQLPLCNGCDLGLTIRIHRIFLDRVNGSIHARETRLTIPKPNTGLPRSEHEGTSHSCIAPSNRETLPDSPFG
jgi:hypothetical protein